jgi:multimeric flavodoxin WrbA
VKKGIIIQASSRSKGDTFKIVSYLQEQTGFDVIDLSQKRINHFDYEFKNQDDDFNDLFKNIVLNYKTIVFATPIYWYTMSGLLKVFMDRISDFLHKEKDFGRLLREKQMAVLSCSNEDKLFEGFTMPFVETANYLGMDFLGHKHTWVENNVIPEQVKQNIREFVAKQIHEKQIN